MTTPSKLLDEAVKAAKKEDYLRGLTLFLEVFDSEDVPSISSAKDASALSYFGLCVALMKREYKGAIELCKRAISLEFYSGDHYMNLSRVYTAAGNRKKALETLEAGLKIAPEHPGLLAVRQELGVRARPAVPFLDRSHPLNVSLGQARHAKQLAEKEKRRGK
jgi:tetratricopeptide (TPR) repeat protein